MRRVERHAAWLFLRVCLVSSTEECKRARQDISFVSSSAHSTSSSVVPGEISPAVRFGKIVGSMVNLFMYIEGIDVSMGSCI